MRGLEIDWVRAIAGALAAVISAVLLSTLGAAGTLLGAALGSLVVTVGSAVLAQGLTTSKETLSKAQARALQKVGSAQADVQRANRLPEGGARRQQLDRAEERLAEANRELDAAASGRAPLSKRLAALPWRRILLVSGALFVVAIVVITVFELLAGRSVSSITGGSDDGRTTIGTTLDDVGDGGQGRDDRPGRDESPDVPATPTVGGTPTQEPTPNEQTTPPTETPSEAPTSPSEGATPDGLLEEVSPSAS